MDKVVGDIVGVPNPKSDWNQTDETKADYIKNKPDIYTKEEVDAKVKAVAKYSGALYGDTNPPPMHSEEIAVGKLYFDTRSNGIYICTDSTYNEKEGIHFITWEELHSSEIEKNTMLFWEPNTKYCVGDQVFANIIESYEDYEKGIYKQKTDSQPIRLGVSIKRQRPWTGMPFAQKSKIFGLHSIPANTTPALLKIRLYSGFSLTRSFFDAPVAEKTKMRLNAA